MVKFTVDSEVVRVNSAAHSNGNRGKVVELDKDEGRVRVYWHTEKDGSPMKDPKRTWVQFKCVQVIFDTAADETAANEAMDNMAADQEAAEGTIRAQANGQPETTTEPETETTVQETPMNATIEAPTASSKANRFQVYGLSVTSVLRAMGKVGGFSSNGALAALEALGAEGLSITTVRIQLLAGKNGQRGEPAQLTKKQLAELTKLAKAADKAAE